MGWHKRNLSEKLIEEKARSSSFEEFKSFLLNSEHYAFSDNVSLEIWESFSRSNVENQLIIFKKIRNES